LLAGKLLLATSAFFPFGTICAFRRGFILFLFFTGR
jgi:hypothetical protein